jgi:hypothetical protein
MAALFHSLLSILIASSSVIICALRRNENVVNIYILNNISHLRKQKFFHSLYLIPFHLILFVSRYDVNIIAARMCKIKSNSQNVLQCEIPYMTGSMTCSEQQKPPIFQSHCDNPAAPATMIPIPEHSEKYIKEPLQGQYMSLK